jgi:hypothetical protein
MRRRLHTYPRLAKRGTRKIPLSPPAPLIHKRSSCAKGVGNFPAAVLRTMAAVIRALPVASSPRAAVARTRRAGSEGLTVTVEKRARLRGGAPPGVGGSGVQVTTAQTRARRRRWGARPSASTTAGSAGISSVQESAYGVEVRRNSCTLHEYAAPSFTFVNAGRKAGTSPKPYRNNTVSRRRRSPSFHNPRPEICQRQRTSLLDTARRALQGLKTS